MGGLQMVMVELMGRAARHQLKALVLVVVGY
jgi:hypothetical protein